MKQRQCAALHVYEINSPIVYPGEIMGLNYTVRNYNCSKPCGEHIPARKPWCLVQILKLISHDKPQEHHFRDFAILSCCTVLSSLEMTNSIDFVHWAWVSDYWEVFREWTSNVGRSQWMAMIYGRRFSNLLLNQVTVNDYFSISITFYKL